MEDIHTYKRRNYFSQDKVSLCSPGYSGFLSVDQAGLELRGPPVCALQIAGIKGVFHHAQLGEKMSKALKKLGIGLAWWLEYVWPMGVALLGGVVLSEEAWPC